MNGEVQLIVRSGQLIIGDVIEPSFATNSNKIGVNYFDGIENLVGMPITIIDSALNEYDGGLIYQVDFGSVFPGLWNIYYNDSVTIDWSLGATFRINTATEYYLDLFENESISQNWKFQDLSNFTAQGAFSREFRVPFSETNKKALGALFDNNVEQGALNYFFYKLPAEIRVDTLPIANGYLRVRKVYKQMGKVNEVEVAFYAETPDLVRTIGEKKLSDIAALADLNEVVNYANVTTETADRVWALCDRGQRWSNSGGATSRPVLDANTPIHPADLTPSVSWWFLLRNIVTEAGFDLVASSLENIIEDYYMPFCNTPQLINTNIPNEYFFRVYNNASFLVIGSNTYLPFEADTLIFDNGGNFNVGTYEYTVPVSGEYTFNGLLKIDGATVDANASVNIGLIINVYPNITNYFNAPVAQGGTQYVPFTFIATLEQGDVVALAMTAVNESFAFTCLAGDGTVNSSYYEINSVNAYSGQTINYSANAPDMRQIDFVNDVIKMHNCAIVPSRIVPNRIAIVPQNNYIGTGDVVDWTSKLDVSKDVVIGSTVDIQKATFQFTYTSGEDAYSKLYRDAGRVYGDFKQEGYTINPSTSPSDFAIGEQKITLVTRSTPAAFIPGTGTPIACFYNEELEFVAPGPRALFYAGTFSINLYNDATSSATPTTQVPILNHYSNPYPVLTDLDLNWAPEVPPHAATVTSNPYNNLFNSYWRNYMNELYSPEGRIMEAFFALDLKDILTFSFADKIWIQDSYWRILEISDYKVGLQESTKVKLIKFLDQINDCASTPTGVTANGEVEFETGGEAVEPTEDCCSRYGYFWDEINGVCWAFNNGGQFRNSIVSSNNALNASSSNLFERFANATTSVIQGQKINVIDSNSNSLLVGENLTLNKSVLGSNLLGKNVLTNLPGLHLGGGYRAGLPTNTETGWSQSGIVHFHRKTGFNAIGDTAELYIEGVSGEHLEIGDSSTMSCMLNLTLQNELQTDIDVAIMSFGLTKVAGVTYATAVTVISNDTFGTGYTYDISIDTATNTAQHRIVLTINAAPSFPITLIATASLHYQQNKLI